MSTIIYSGPGICYLSACTDDSDEVATAVVNRLCPSETPWVIAEEDFRSGEPNPHPCEKDPARRHVLFTA